MTAAHPHAFPSFTTRPRRARPQWRRAYRALRELLRDSSRTERAFEVIAALDPGMMERGLARMLAHPEGRRLFALRPLLLERLRDREALARLPEGSLGRAYLEHIERHGLDPGKLVELGRAKSEIRAEDEGARWFADRSELGHDLLHVLTGYGADGLGETALLWFSHGLSGGRGTALLMVGAGLHSWRNTEKGFARYLWRAWRRGRHAGCLESLPWEELLGAAARGGAAPRRHRAARARASGRCARRASRRELIRPGAPGASGYTAPARRARRRPAPSSRARARPRCGRRRAWRRRSGRSGRPSGCA